jgi:sortase A
MTSPARRRAPLIGAAGVLLVAALGLTSWSLRAGDGEDGAIRVLDQPVPVTTAPPTPSTAPPAPSTTPAAAPELPQPEDAPADAYADTPDVVHGTLALPTIGVSEPLHEGVTLTAIDRGPSHWPGTALPGQLGNVVVAGHRVTHTKPFHDLDMLVPGDPLVFTMNDGTTWTYQLTGTEIVTPDALHIVDQLPDHTATLFACHPKGSAAQRIVAHFRLVGAS